MLIYDQSFIDTMAATRREATALGAHVYGSEHVLLCLLAETIPLTGAVTSAWPLLTYEAMAATIARGDDDAALLGPLGLTALATAVAEAPRPQRTPRNRHTPELQSALNSASTKWGLLRKHGAITRESKLSSAVLWLSVLEPATRSSQLMKALGVDADQARATVLATCAPPGAAAPTWPETTRPDPLTRAVRKLFNRLSAAA